MSKKSKVPGMLKATPKVWAFSGDAEYAAVTYGPEGAPERFDGTPQAVADFIRENRHRDDMVVTGCEQYESATAKILKGAGVDVIVIDATAEELREEADRRAWSDYADKICEGVEFTHDRDAGFWMARKDGVAFITRVLPLGMDGKVAGFARVGADVDEVVPGVLLHLSGESILCEDMSEDWVPLLFETEEAAVRDGWAVSCYAKEHDLLEALPG